MAGACSRANLRFRMDNNSLEEGRRTAKIVAPALELWKGCRRFAGAAPKSFTWDSFGSLNLIA
jgi:hypothetical protein